MQLRSKRLRASSVPECISRQEVRSETNSGIPQETSGSLDGVMLQGMVHAFKDIGRHFGKALANGVDQLWRWLRIISDGWGLLGRFRFFAHNFLVLLWQRGSDIYGGTP